jgi:hypothetical protein
METRVNCSTTYYDVLTSLHLNTKKIIDEYRSNNYLMPPHEALRAILYGDFIHYFPEKSLVINLFDIQKADPLEHFTRLLSLNYLASISEGSTLRWLSSCRPD